MGRTIWEHPVEVRLGEGFRLGMLFRSLWKKIIFICVCGWHKICQKETKHWSDVESTQQRSWFGRTNVFPWSCVFGMYWKTIWNKQRFFWQLQIRVWIQNFRRSNWKTALLKKTFISSWSFDMEGHAKKWVERYCELGNRTTQQFYKVSTPCIDDHHFKEEDMKSVGKLSKVCSQIVLKFLYLTRIGRADIQRSVNKFARSITKWTNVCDKRLCRFIFYIHQTCEYQQYYYVGNTARHCRLGLFQESDFAGDLEDSKSTSGGTLCFFWKSYICSNKFDVQETNCCFSQFNRIRNHFFGRKIEIGWVACSGTMGSNCFCSWKCFSCFRSIEKTWEWCSQTS